MRRLPDSTITTIIVLVVTSVLPVSAAAQSAADPTPPAPQLVAPDGQCGRLRDGADAVRFGGAAAPGSSLISSSIHELDADGRRIGPVFTRSGQQLTPKDVRNHISLDPNTGQFAGMREPLGLLQDNTVAVQLEVTVQLDGFQTTGVSSAVAVDRVMPRILDYQTLSTRSIKVTFSEDVFAPKGDSGFDWVLPKANQATPPTRGEDATGVGRVRIVAFPADSIGEDEEPVVEYDPHFPIGSVRAEYRDCVGRDLAAGFDHRIQKATDRVPPRVPNILAIAGKTPTGPDRHVAGQADSFSVEVGRATNGHSVELWRETNVTAGFDGSDHKLADGIVSSGNVTLPVNSIGPDGTYKLYARAIDIHGNTSDAPGVEGVDTATYIRDGRPPSPRAASSDGKTVVVSFDDALVPAGGEAADWRVESSDLGGITVVHAVERVEGSGDTRVLRAPGVPDGARVRYDPAGGGYSDEAGNPLAAWGPIRIQGLVPTVVDLEPELGADPVTTSHRLTATIRDDAGNLTPGAHVSLRATSGPTSSRDADEDPLTSPGVIAQCLSAADGTCDFAYSSSEVGRDVLQAWIGDASSFPIPESQDASGVADAKDQDVVRTDWTIQNGDVRVDAEPEDSTGPVNEPHFIVARVTKNGGSNAEALIGGVTIGARVLEGPNAGKTVGACVTDVRGSCSIANNSTVVGTDQIQLWVDLNKSGVPDGGELFLDRNEQPGADSSITGAPIEDDPAQDVVVRNWVGVSIPTLQVEPEQLTLVAGSIHSLQMSTLDQSGQPIQGLNVDARVVSGPNMGDYLSECLTDQAGMCTLTYSSEGLGTDFIQGWIDANGDNQPDEATQFEPQAESSDSDETDQDVAAVTWTEPEQTISPSPTPTPSATETATPTPTPSATETATPTPTPTPSESSTTQSSESPSASPSASPGESPSPSPSASDSPVVSPSLEVRRMTISVSKTRTGFRRPVTLSGTIASGDSRCTSGTVTLAREINDQFEDFRTVDAIDGSWSWTLKPSKTAQYRARLDEDRTCESASTDSAMIAVRARVVARGPKDVVPAGSCIGVRGSVTPAKPGGTVRLLESSTHHWRVVASKKLGQASKFHFRRCLRDTDIVLKVRVAADGSNASGSSRRIYVNVV